MHSPPRALLAIVALALVVAAAAPGCRMFGQQSAVTPQVAQARQLSQRGLSAMEKGDAASAEQLLGQAVKVCPDDIESRRHYAEALWQSGQRELALQNMLQALAQSPDDATLAVRAGEMQLDLGLLDDAQAVANQVLDANPNDGGAWALRGRVHRARGKLDRGLADLERA